MFSSLNTALFSFSQRPDPLSGERVGIGLGVGGSSFWNFNYIRVVLVVTTFEIVLLI